MQLEENSIPRLPGLTDTLKYFRIVSCGVSARSIRINYLLSSLHDEHALAIFIFFLLAGTGDEIWFIKLPWNFRLIFSPSILHILLILLPSCLNLSDHGSIWARLEINCPSSLNVTKGIIENKNLIGFAKVLLA